MNPFFSARWATVILLAVCCVCLSGCGPRFGEKIVVNATEIYYKAGAEKSDAEKIGKLLKGTGFADGKKKSVQLQKRDDILEFRIAVSGKSHSEPSVKNSLKPLALEISSVFDGGKVEVHLCNQKLETVSVVKGLRGKKFSYAETDFYYHNLDLKQVQEISAIVFALNPSSQPGLDFHISKPDKTVIIRMPNSAPISKPMSAFAFSVAQATSQQVFDGELVEFVLCSLQYDPDMTIASDGTSKTN